MIYLFYLIFTSFALFAGEVDDMFRFEELYLPEFVEYETTRKFCLFSFRKDASNKKLDYLSNGIPSVIISQLNGFQYIFDEKPLEKSISYSYGKNKPPEKVKGFKETRDRNYINDLNSGKLEVVAVKDPRYIKLNVELIQQDPAPFSESAIEIGRKNNCFYVLTGEFTATGNDSLGIKAELFFRKDGKRQNLSENTSIKRGFQEMKEIPEKIKRLITSREFVTIEIDTGEEKDALVFLDNVYAGKTPLIKLDTHFGLHSMIITKDGFKSQEKLISLKKGFTSKYSFSLEKIAKKGKISVDSNPEGALVYLGGTFLGETPIKDAEVPIGPNRLRIAKEKHIDKFIGVEIEEGKPSKISAKLKEGDNDIYYKNAYNVFLDYTYFDFAFYSLTASLVAYASYGYNYVRSEQILESRSLRLYYTTITYSYLYNSGNQPTLPLGNSPSFLFYLQYSQILNKFVENNEARQHQNLEKYSIYTGGTMLILSGLFFWLGFNHEAMEVGFKRDSITPHGTEAYAKIHFRF